MENIQKIIEHYLPLAPFDAVAVGIIDFKNSKFDLVEAETDIFFDLASLTKPLTNSLSYFLNPSGFTPEMLLCLNHKAGIPAWGLLPQTGWKEQILNYKIKESPTLYSDFSALRVMLELEKKGVDQKKRCQKIWDKDLMFWLDLSEDATTLQNGYKNQQPNFAEVHDPNAYVINSYCSHAGLFSTLKGLAQTLLNYQQQTEFIEKVKNDLAKHSNRFSFGWDRVENPATTLAGVGCGRFTFGHLGFTGTSIWIDPEKMRGHIILTNAVKEHWFDKEVLNEMRRAIGEAVWRI